MPKQHPEIYNASVVWL